MLVAVQSHLEMPGQDEVLSGVLLIPVFFYGLEHVTPSGGAMFHAPSPVFPAGSHGQCGAPIPQGKEQQAPSGVVRPADGQGTVHGFGQPAQQLREAHSGAPASRCQQRRPPDDGKRQQPHPPWIFSSGYRIKTDHSFLKNKKSPPGSHRGTLPQDPGEMV